ncbi:unannotated protein [freshwater metagenome]|uniref:Unannotated protein n=1 Tax=freshwater metagenome TaxID=449393 RepID=A0A6J6NQ82_9ZZZZ
MSGRLAGKVAIVTGGGSGLGRAIALAYAAEGASVVVASVVAAADEGAVSEIEALGGNAFAFPADVRNQAELEGLVAAAVGSYGRLDVFVAAAGIDVRRSPVREDRYLGRLEPEDWDTVIATNLTGTFLSARAALPSLAETHGSFIAFTSGTVRHPAPGLGAYVASKAGIEGMVSVLALEATGDRVRVNLLQPGGVTDTGFFGPEVPTERRAAMHRPSVIGPCAVFLASDASVEVTGASFDAAAWNGEQGIDPCGCPGCASRSGGEPPETAAYRL